MNVQALEGLEVEIIIRKKRSKRSIQQNKYLWGVVYKLIARYTGYNEEEIHELCKALFLKKHLQIGKKRYTTVGSTTDLSTVEFENYTSEIRQWASMELDVFIPLPNEVEP